MLESSLNPALIVVDMQNDFVRAGAPLEVVSARHTIPAIARLLAAFRSRGNPVLYTRYVADPRYWPLAARLNWIGLTKAPVHACTPGIHRSYRDRQTLLDGAEVIDELAPAPGEGVIDKVYFSAFHDTGLHDVLGGLGVDAVIFTGTVTEMCVEDSARHCVHFGYPTLIVEDAVSSNDQRGHEAALRAFARNYGWVMTADRVLETFKCGRERQHL